MRKYEYVIGVLHNDITVFDYLKKEHGYSRRMLTKIRNEPQSINCNGKHIRMVDTLKQGDVLTISLSEQGYILPNDELTADIAYEDSDIIVLNKPYDMPVHPSKNHQTNTLANVFASVCSKREESLKFRPINRLDKDTSGLCVVAKNQYCASALSGKIEKEYVALIKGKLQNQKGTIDLPIARIDQKGIKRCVSDDGQRAVTHYAQLKHREPYTLVSVKLETGRTHQIRVHFSHLGFPLVGDELYGGDISIMKRQALHCKSVTFTHPITHENITVTSKIPDDFILQ